MKKTERVYGYDAIVVDAEKEIFDMIKGTIHTDTKNGYEHYESYYLDGLLYHVNREAHFLVLHIEEPEPEDGGGLNYTICPIPDIIEK